MELGFRGHQLKTTAACFIAFPTIAVAGRLWSRVVVAKSHFGLDDLFCVLALIMSLEICGSAFPLADYGLGMHLLEIEFKSIEPMLRILYVDYWFFYAAMSFVKLSALCLYTRIFGRENTAFNKAIIGGYVLSALFWLYTAVQTLTACNPIKKNWEFWAHGTCMPLQWPFLAIAAVDTIVDLYILILPLPMIWRLQMKLNRKITAAIALIIGYCTLVVSLGRLVEISVAGNISFDFTYKAFRLLVWSLAEPNVAVIGLCLPAWFALIRRGIRGGPSSLFHSQDLSVPLSSPESLYRPRTNSLHAVSSYEYSASGIAEDSSKNLSLAVCRELPRYHYSMD